MIVIIIIIIIITIIKFKKCQMVETSGALVNAD